MSGLNLIDAAESLSDIASSDVDAGDNDNELRSDEDNEDDGDESRNVVALERGVEGEEIEDLDEVRDEARDDALERDPKEVVGEAGSQKG